MGKLTVSTRIQEVVTVHYTYVSYI